MSGQLEVEQKEIKTPGLIGLYSEIPRAAGLRVDIGLSYDEIEALIYESTLYLEREPVESKRKMLFTPRYYERMDRWRIQNLKRHILNDKPKWVRKIKEIMLHENQIYWIVNLSGVPPYPGVAITEALIERGEAPEDVA